jgi:hypothetical protein
MPILFLAKEPRKKVQSKFSRWLVLEESHFSNSSLIREILASVISFKGGRSAGDWGC